MAVGNEHSIEELKKIRSTAKANVTRKINRLNELMSSNNILQAVEEKNLQAGRDKNDLYETVNEFQLAHNAYHEKLENEEEKSNSSQYCAAVLEEAEKHKMKVNLWLSEQNKNKLVDDVQPDDSISNVSSSRSKKSKVSSVRSSASAKARAAARKAALEAKAASLQKLHELQFEELKLQQRKAEIELRAEIAVAEAERWYTKRVKSKTCIVKYIRTLNCMNIHEKRISFLRVVLSQVRVNSTLKSAFLIYRQTNSWKPLS